MVTLQVTIWHSMFQMNASGLWFGQPSNVSAVCTGFCVVVAISLLLGGRVGTHGLPGGANCKMGVRGAVLMCGDGSVLGGKLWRLAGLYIAGVSLSGPSRSVRSGVGLLLSCFSIMILLFALSVGAFSLALNWPSWPCGGSMCLLGGMSVLSYVYFYAYAHCFCLDVIVWHGSDATLITTLGGVLPPCLGWFEEKGCLQHLS